MNPPQDVPGPVLLRPADPGAEVGRDPASRLETTDPASFGARSEGPRYRPAGKRGLPGQLFVEGPEKFGPRPVIMLPGVLTVQGDQQESGSPLPGLEPSPDNREKIRPRGGGSDLGVGKADPIREGVVSEEEGDTLRGRLPGHAGIGGPFPL